MDGFDATMRIREIERVIGGLRGSTTARSRIPIVALTAHALAEVRERCLEAGMDDFLVKPFDEQQMVDMLGRWLNPHRDRPGCRTRAVQSPPKHLPRRRSTWRRWKRSAPSAVCAGRSLLGRIVAQFAATSAPLVATMRERCAAGDPEAVWRAAHSLKSSAAAVGASGVAERCGQIESGGAGRPHSAAECGDSRARLTSLAPPSRAPQAGGRRPARRLSPRPPAPAKEIPRGTDAAFELLLSLRGSSSSRKPLRELPVRPFRDRRRRCWSSMTIRSSAC